MEIRKIIKPFYYKMRNKELLNIPSGVNYIEAFKSMHKNYDPCFVLSPGRSGTAFLTKLLNSHKNIITNHNNRPELILHSKYAYEHPDETDILQAVFEASRYEQLLNYYLSRLKYVETNNRITFFAPEISKLYEKSKFIQLVRNPKKFIISGLNRNWYTGLNNHDIGRINTDVNYSVVNDDIKIKIKKITWLWNETYLFIEKFFDTLPEDRKLTVRAEDLFIDKSTIYKIDEFIGIEKIKSNKLNRIFYKPVNSQKKREISIFDELEDDIKKIYFDIINKRLVKKFLY